MNILAIDTSNELLGIALQKDGKLVAENMTHIKKDHSARLMPAIVHLMKQVEMEPAQLNQIVVAKGPGSYTGVRIGITTAKSMAWALNIPIYTISSLQALAYNGVFFDGYIWPFFNARRGAMFTALYELRAGKMERVIDEQYVTFQEWQTHLSNLTGENILCLSPHIDQFSEEIQQQLRYVEIPPNYMHLLRPGNLIDASEDLVEEQVHIVKPNYLRITEAEANLIKSKKR